MFLEGVKEVVEPDIPETKSNGHQKIRDVFDHWKNWPISEISHHGTICCEIAREWVTATDYAELGGSSVLSGPRWLCRRFKWGASSFPIYWCEAVRRKVLDCGALAALAHEAFTIRGVKSYRVQLVQRFSVVATEQWSQSWMESGVQPCWINNDLIYHEGCAIPVNDRQLKVWDASAGWWIDPRASNGYGSLLAIRIYASEKATLVWGHHTVTPSVWKEIA